MSFNAIQAYHNIIYLCAAKRNYPYRSHTLKHEVMRVSTILLLTIASLQNYPIFLGDRLASNYVIIHVATDDIIMHYYISIHQAPVLSLNAPICSFSNFKLCYNRTSWQLSDIVFLVSDHYIGCTT